MPQIPLVESREDVRVGGIDVYSSPNTFGAQIGSALRELGGEVSGFGRELAAEAKAKENRQRQLDTANAVAGTSIKFAQIATDEQVNAPADGEGVMQNTLAKQRQEIEDTAATIKDPIARQDYRVNAIGRLVPYAQTNVQFEAERKAKNAKDLTNYSLNGLENTIRSNPMQYDSMVKDGHVLIDAQDLSDDTKSTMKKSWDQRTAFSRFQGMMAGAKSQVEFDVIKADLEGGDGKWQKVFTPEQYAATLIDVAQSKRDFTTVLGQQVRAALDSAEKRSGDMVEIPPDEMSQINEMANNLMNPVEMSRAHRLQRSQQILIKGRKLPAAELEARANVTLNGGYPGMPDEVNKAISEAVTTFPGISASFFGGTAVQEYGKYLPRGVSRKGDNRFSPRPLRDNVNLRSMKPEAVNALTLAGEIYGAPLPIMSGHRTQAKQNAIRNRAGSDPSRRSVASYSRHTEGDGADISTVGMSAVQKGKLVDALLQAGFTGFGEYGTHIHADMRSETTQNFNPATGELGWSKGSPEVVAAMVARGYKPGVPSGALTRGGAGQPKVKVDYSRGTDNGSSSATGLMQQTQDTWLESVKDPRVTQRVGLNTAGMSDAQLLELRKDPRLSVLITGAQAEQNQKTLESVFGRPVTDAELYMAHLLGAGGAQNFISAYTNNPDAKAADLMPEAAKNNPGKFYENGKALSVRDAYDKLATDFSTAPNQIQYGDAQVYQKMATAAKKGESEAPMLQYNNNVAPVNDLQAEGGYVARAATASAAAGLYNLPIDEMKPFLPNEQASMVKQIAEGTVAEQLSVMQNIQQMDKAVPGMGKAAYAQLGVTDTTFEQAAYVAGDLGDTATAEQIMRGSKRLELDKTMEQSLFGPGTTPLQDFNSATGGALLAVDPATRNAIFNATKALYAEKMAQQGTFEFSSEIFKAAAAQAVGGINSTGVGDVNGKPTVLPPGVTSEVFDTAVNAMTDADLVAFSRDGAPPVSIEGDAISAQDIAAEGEFVFVGGNTYKVRMSDGSYLVTGERESNGMLKAYGFEVTAETLKAVASRPAQTSQVAPEGDFMSIGKPSAAPSGGGMFGAPQ
jgi:uncharacterized protein YcbK (DUF882 family)